MSSDNAGIVSRGVAAVIDLIVVGGILGALYAGLALTMLMFHPRAFQLPTPSFIFSSVVLFTVSVLYLTACWVVSGCTIGAVVMGLRVVDIRSQRLSPVPALLRALACVVFPAGLLWAVVDRNRRSLQDVVLRTRVVYVRP